MPLWMSAVLAFAGILYFNIYWEATLLFLLSDLFYGTNETKNSPMIFLSFFISVVILVILEMLKKKLRFYDNKNI
jgi:hypothetical protein